MRCQDQINVCVSNPCTNSGTCIGTAASYSCYCPAGYTGVNCELAINPCSNNPCLNNGLCITTNNPLVFQCQCLPSNNFKLSKLINNTNTIIELKYNQGYAGLRCETRINECQSNPCANGATCQQVLNSLGYNCYCPIGYTGTLCDRLLTYCTTSSCKNGGSCIERPPGGYACNCMPGYTGFDCSVTVNL